MKKLKGIGSSFAKRIVAYREKLGGYHSTEQLLEVYGMDSVRFEMIRDEIYIGDSTLRQFSLAHMKKEEIVKHPYIDYKLANAIMNLRYKNGALASVDELRAVYLVDDSLYRKIAPYFTTE